MIVAMLKKRTKRNSRIIDRGDITMQSSPSWGFSHVTHWDT